MARISEFPYSADRIEDMRLWHRSTNWPVTYIIHNDEEAYVGETLDAVYRTQQHLAEPEHDMLDQICLITDDTYNKSVILDLESFLIKYMSADGRFRLQNGNAGVQNHDYFNREIYENNFQQIWRELMQRGLVRQSLAEIENSDLFKYSPYKALTREQEHTLADILRSIRTNPNPGQQSLTLVQGGAGTGKTVLAIYLIKLLTEITQGDCIWADDSDIDYIDELRACREALPQRKLKIGFVVPMQSLRTTLQGVFRSINGLSADMIISPTQVPQQHYDLLVVDEAHRLHQRKCLAKYPAHDQNNAHFGLGNEGTELDWILRSSDRQVLFYDPLQSIRPSDIDRDRFEDLCRSHLYAAYSLSSQLRCLGGKDYVDYIKKVLSGKGPIGRSYFANYDLRLFDDVGEMTDLIKNLDEHHGLCRTVAGYGFPWNSKKDANAYDVVIGDYKARWNGTMTDWIGSANSVNEIGCIHTVQGYDLNYCGVIFGPEISYNPEAQEMVINKAAYYDSLGKAKVNDTELHDYIINIYVTLMTRGIRGTYVYACDDALREYLRGYLG